MKLMKDLNIEITLKQDNLQKNVIELEAEVERLKKMKCVLSHGDLEPEGALEKMSRISCTS